MRSFIVLADGSEQHAKRYRMISIHSRSAVAMSRSEMNILDLPNEILVMIFKNLHSADALYSLIDVNDRFASMVLDSLHIRRLDTVMLIRKYQVRRCTSIVGETLSEICNKILPRFHERLNELVVDQHSMEHLLRVVPYSRLGLLSLLHFDEATLLRCLTGMLANLRGEFHLFNFELIGILIEQTMRPCVNSWLDKSHR